MADRITIARPYAKAAFAAAKVAGRLGEWSAALERAAIAVGDARVSGLIGSPKVTPTQLADLLIELSGASIDDSGRNFIRTLADNRRLGHLPEIALLFGRLKDEAEGTVDVTVTSAAPLAQAEQDKLADALAKRFGRKVRVHANVDAQLMGGAVVRAGDLVIDGSVKSRLERLAYELTA
ncbi:MAG: F0F1 ATP synthase subunit delta [Steroidobacteraceae bacterium]